MQLIRRVQRCLFAEKKRDAGGEAQLRRECGNLAASIRGCEHDPHRWRFKRSVFPVENDVHRSHDRRKAPVTDCLVGKGRNAEGSDSNYIIARIYNNNIIVSNCYLSIIYRLVSYDCPILIYVLYTYIVTYPCCLYCANLCFTQLLLGHLSQDLSKIMDEVWIDMTGVAGEPLFRYILEST